MAIVKDEPAFTATFQLILVDLATHITITTNIPNPIIPNLKLSRCTFN
jgi:hypothetical protein